MFNSDAYVWGTLTGMFLLFAALFLIPVIFFLITQMNTLKLIDPQNRSMEPGQVWLQLIPLFGMVWQFIVVTRISDSIKKQLHAPGFSFETQEEQPMNLSEERPTYQIGIAYCSLAVASMIPMVGGIAGLAALVCWIVYWVKLAEYKNKLIALKLQQG